MPPPDPLTQPGIVGRVAFAIIEGSAGTRAAEHAREFVTANWADALRSARAAIEAMEGGWQDIATAPPEELEQVILWNGKVTSGCRWESCWIDFYSDWMNPQPSLWQPLPSAPAALSEQRGAE